jgi:hypothetical protein
MSLLEFLRIGHSFIGIKDAPSPYRMAKENLLPNFAAPETSRLLVAPTSARVRSVPEANREVNPPGLPGKVEECGHLDLGDHASGQSQDKSMKGSKATRLDPVPAAEIAATVIPATRKTRKGGFLWFRPSARGGERLRQGELSLETVQVMRNDLKDCDLEFVLKRSEPAVEGPPDRSAANEEKQNAGGIQGWAVRWFKSGRLTS